MNKATKKELLKRIEALEEFSTYADNMLTELNHALPDPEYDAKCEEDAVAVQESLARHAVRLGLGLKKPELTGSDLARAMLARGDKCVLIRMGVRDDKQAKDIGRFAIATSIDESGRFNVMSDQQPISKVDFAVPINNQGEPLTASEVGL